MFGLLLVALLGRKVVDPGNKDFQFLTPKPLALALFSSLFIAFGLLVVPLVERFDRGFPLGDLGALSRKCWVPWLVASRKLSVCADVWEPALAAAPKRRAAAKAAPIDDDRFM